MRSNVIIFWRPSFQPLFIGTPGHFEKSQLFGFLDFLFGSGYAGLGERRRADQQETQNPD
jgi:hypothetical protein